MSRQRTIHTWSIALGAALAVRTGYGGTAPARVREQIERLDATLATFTTWLGR